MKPTALRRCFLSKALGDRSVASEKKICGRAGFSLALLSRAPCSRPGFKQPRRNKQTQPPQCSVVLGLGCLSMPITISWCRRGLAFCSGAKADSGTRPKPFPQERRGDRIPAHRPCTGMGSCGGLSPLLPRTPRASANASTSCCRTVSNCPFLLELFLRVQARAPGSKPTSALWTDGQGAAVTLGPEAQKRPDFSLDSFRVEHALLP